VQKKDIHTDKIFCITRTNFFKFSSSLLLNYHVKQSIISGGHPHRLVGSAPLHHLELGSAPRTGIAFPHRINFSFMSKLQENFAGFLCSTYFKPKRIVLFYKNR